MISNTRWSRLFHHFPTSVPIRFVRQRDCLPYTDHLHPLGAQSNLRRQYTQMMVVHCALLTNIPFGSEGNCSQPQLFVKIRSPVNGLLHVSIIVNPADLAGADPFNSDLTARESTLIIGFCHVCRQQPTTVHTYFAWERSFRSKSRARKLMVSTLIAASLSQIVRRHSFLLQRRSDSTGNTTLDTLLQTQDVDRWSRG